jgi:hypothetical protein
MLSCSRPNIPVGVLWLLRVVALVATAIAFFGPTRVRSYGACAVFGVMGIGDISSTTASWQSAGPGGILFGKVVVVVMGLGLLAAASAVLIVDCGLR